MQKIGTRKMPPGVQSTQPAWLFPQAGKPTQANGAQSRESKNQEKKFADDLLKRRAAGESAKLSPPPQLLELVGSFLSEHEYTQTSRTFLSERNSQITANLAGVPSLTTIYNEWRQLKDKKNEPASQHSIKEGIKPKVTKEDSSSNDSDSSSTSSDDEDSDVEMMDTPAPTVAVPQEEASISDSSSDSDADDESDTPVINVLSSKPKINNLKRKASSSSSSSSSGSDSDSDSSSEDEAPKAKKVRTNAINPSKNDSSSGSSSSDSSSDSDSSSGSEIITITKIEVNTSSSGSDSSSSDSGSDSDSDSDSSTNSVAQKVPLPDSDGDESSSADSDSSSETPSRRTAVKKHGSDTSATLSDGPKKLSSPDSSSDSSSSSDPESEPVPTKVTTKVTETTRKLSPPLPPEPVVKSQKKTNQPFSRIPKDIKVDERLASNAYVPYDYAQKAHEDLIVTKGKGFTKEKNKKKRGSYKGGYIDVDGKKGIKFED